jgi:hypothetical protein
MRHLVVRKGVNLEAEDSTTFEAMIDENAGDWEDLVRVIMYCNESELMMAL